MVDEKLVEIISEFGLTSKQAKTYAAVIAIPNCGIAEISHETGLHVQDIYKILIKLEKRGLVTRVQSKPIRVTPVDVEFALNKLVKIQEKRINGQKKNIQKIKQILKKQQKKAEELEEGFVILPAKSQAVKNRVELVFRTMQKTYDNIQSEDCFLTRAMPYFIDSFQNFVSSNVKTRLLIITNDNESHLTETIAKAKWPPCEITIKTTRSLKRTHYAIIDGKELWVPAEELVSWGKVLFTDYEALVRIAKENFEFFWEHPETKTIYYQEKRKKTTRKESLTSRNF